MLAKFMQNPAILLSFTCIALILGLAVYLAKKRKEWRFFRKDYLIYQFVFILFLSIILLILQKGLSFQLGELINSNFPNWPLSGTYRLGLALLALIYGPIVSGLCALCFSIVYFFSGASILQCGLIVLECLILGILGRNLILKKQYIGSFSAICLSYFLSLFCLAFPVYILKQGYVTPEETWWIIQAELGGCLLTAILFLVIGPSRLLQFMPFTGKQSKAASLSMHRKSKTGADSKPKKKNASKS